MATDKFPSSGQLPQLEHDEQNHAKRVNNYIWNSNTGTWERADRLGAAVTERYDYSSSTTIYVGSADVGTSDSSTGWRITKYDLSSSSNASGKIATDVSWNNRSSGTYA
jgi:hypothetical protein